MLKGELIANTSKAAEKGAFASYRINAEYHWHEDLMNYKYVSKLQLDGVAAKN